MKNISSLINVVASAQVRFCSWSMVVLGLAMTFTILIQIFFRFVVYQPVPWSEELARYLMIWMGMLGSVVALRKGRHIGVNFLVEKLPGRVRQFTVRLVRLVIIGFLAIIGWEGLGLAVFNAPQLSAAMEISMTIPYLAIPVGATMMIIDLIADIFQDYFPTAIPMDASSRLEPEESTTPHRITRNSP